MPIVIRKAVIVFCSPAGSTKHVAEVIERSVRSLETPLTVIDLAEDRDIPFLMTQLVDAKDNVCLYIGSPVYACRPVPPVMTFISLLPPAHEGYAVPFVTWGGVSSGVALHVMGKGLQEKGYRILGGAKVLAQHSLMWCCDTPLGPGHPNPEDDRVIQSLVGKVNAKLRSEAPEPLPLSRLAYHPVEHRVEMERSNLAAAKNHLPRRELVQERCTRCGVCEEVCPVEAVSLAPDPVFHASCISCFNCVRLCPEEAIQADLTQVFTRLKARAAGWNETPPTEIFL